MAPLKSKKAKLSLRKKGGNKSMKRVGRKPAKKTMRKRKGGNHKLTNKEAQAVYETLKYKCDVNGNQKDKCIRDSKLLYNNLCSRLDYNQTAMNSWKKKTYLPRYQYDTTSERCKNLAKTGTTGIYEESPNNDVGSDNEEEEAPHEIRV